MMKVSPYAYDCDYKKGEELEEWCMLMTDKQKQLIECMNEFCKEKSDLSYQRTKEEARDYISKNIEEYKLLSMDNWNISHGYF